MACQPMRWTRSVERINYPIENFFSALAMVCRKSFSAFAVKELACIKEMPYGFGDAGVLAWDEAGDDGEA